jgi:hypothetical protein
MRPPSARSGAVGQRCRTMLVAARLALPCMETQGGARTLSLAPDSIRAAVVHLQLPRYRLRLFEGPLAAYSQRMKRRRPQPSCATPRAR